MKTEGKSLERTPKGAARLVARFCRDEEGSMVIFALFLFILMLLITGMAVDFMRIETTRTKIQNTLDRAVLAAADLDQTRPRDEVVIDYMTKAGLADTLASPPSISEGLNFSNVSAVAEADVPLLFAGFGSIVDPNQTYHSSLIVPAVSTAEERVSKVEISLVLDMSGSMAQNNRIGNLRTAASEFVNSVLADGNEDVISVSLVPYSEHVSMGRDLFNAINVNRTHEFTNYCIEFSDNDFYSTQISPTAGYNQVQYLEWVNYNYNTMYYPVCAIQESAQIIPWSGNRSQLLNRISQLQPYSQTSIYLGMKWGVGLLDPSMRPATNTLINRGVVSSTYSGRPVDYSDTETLKFVILMTDGENTASYRLTDWAYSDYNFRYHWYRNNVVYWLQRNVYQWDWWRYIYLKQDNAYGNRMLDRICTAAKNQGITIWTIGFETTEQGAQVMESCASSPSHYFDVQGIQISDAFSAIATQINNLKLVH